MKDGVGEVFQQNFAIVCLTELVTHFSINVMWCQVIRKELWFQQVMS